LGAVVALPLVFYAVTGIALNHRKGLGYFQERTARTRAVAPRDVTPLREFIAFYKDQLGRQDDPAVIRIKGERTVEFLYGSHGQTTYTIDPVAGQLTERTKRGRQPWTTLNALHRAFKTPTPWPWVSDTLTLALLGALLTGFWVPGAWRRSSWALAGWSVGFATLLSVFGWLIA
jgi:hypothetical protein